MRGQRRLAQYAQKLNVSIASDDLPDLMWVDAAQLKRMVEDDMLADLTDVYANYAAEFTNKVLTDDGGSAMEAATFGGKLYGLPHIQSGYGSTEVLWVRADWLEKLGLDTPKTMEDVLNAARAIGNAGSRWERRRRHLWHRHQQGAACKQQPALCGARWLLQCLSCLSDHLGRDGRTVLLMAAFSRR